MSSYRGGLCVIFFALLGLTFGACGSSDSGSEEVECANGDTRTVACGPNGLSEQAQVCRNYQWEKDGFCIDKTECTQDTTKDAACGYNDRGTVALRCGNNGRWRPADDDRVAQCEDAEDVDQCICDDPDVCEDGDVEEAQACGPADSGTLNAECFEGQWTPQAGEVCEGADTCEDGAEEIVACGLNDRGSETWFCENTEWTVSVPCTDPDECTDDETRHKPCFGEPGINGEKVEISTCVEGQWGDYSACVDPDVCENGREMWVVCGDDALGTTLSTCVSGQWTYEEACLQTAESIYGASHGLGFVSGTDTRMSAFGDNASGKLGTDEQIAYSTWVIPSLAPAPTTPAGEDNVWFERHGASNTHQCAIALDNSLWCWGDNSMGQLGPNANGMAESAEPVKFTKNSIKSVAVGEGFTCAIREIYALNEQRVLLCWGDNQFGQLGVTGMQQTSAPQEVMQHIHAISAGRAHACALDEDKELVCWGANEERQVAATAQDIVTTPTVSELSNSATTSVPAGALTGAHIEWFGAAGDSTYALWKTPSPQNMGTTTRYLLGVGSNARGQLGLDLDDKSAAPVLIHSSVNAIISERWRARGGTLCVMSTNMVGGNHIRCIGDNRMGKYAASTPDGFHAEFQSLSYDGLAHTVVDTPISDFVLGEESLCLRHEDRIACRGGNAYGQLGDGTTTARESLDYVLHPSEKD